MQTAISGVKNLFCNPLFLLPQVPADKFLPLPMHLSQSSSPRCRQSGCNLRKRFLPLMKHIGINIHIFYFRAQCSRKYYLVQTHANSFSLNHFFTITQLSLSCKKYILAYYCTGSQQRLRQQPFFSSTPWRSSRNVFVS